MFTGIIQGKATLKHLVRKSGLFTYEFEFPEDQSSTEIGASVALNGTCLTVTKIQNTCLSFDLMAETIKLTNLAELNQDDRVNFEHAAKIGDEIGGHITSGHVHCLGKVTRITPTENNLELKFEVPDKWQRYIFDKGYIAINGASLTVGSVDNKGFTVNLIPETLRVTTFSQLQLGDSVNIEVDTQTQTIVDTMERIMPGLINEYLANNR